MKSQVVPFLCELVGKEDDTDVLYEACWCILELCMSKNKIIIYMIENGVLKALKIMVSFKNKKLARSAIRTLGNWCIQSSKIKDFILSCKIHEFIIGI